MPISPYQQEHLEACSIVSRHLDSLNADHVDSLKDACRDYLQFRNEVDTFLEAYFGVTCTGKCFQSSLSACCSREGIIAFFGDVVVNALYSSGEEMQRLMAALQTPNTGSKCVYLGPRGCLWQIKPIVCEMFLCDAAMEQVFSAHPEAEPIWKSHKMREKEFTWPDKPVLFDDLEAFFMNAGYDSSLMYLHLSPGLLLVKKRAGL